MTTSALTPARLTPRMSTSEQDRYKSLLTKSRSIIEFGTGGSTLLALSTPVEKIISVESDVTWILKLREDAAIAAAESDGRLHLNWADIGPVRSWGHPADRRYQFKWQSYSAAYWALGHFDTALIDGRFRVACAIQAALHDCPSIVIHDFSIRPEYHVVLQVLDATEQVDTLAVLKPKDFLDRSLADTLYEQFKNNPA